MTVLYPNLCYKEMCYKGTVLYHYLMDWLICFITGITHFLMDQHLQCPKEGV